MSQISPISTQATVLWRVSITGVPVVIERQNIPLLGRSRGSRGKSSKKGTAGHRKATDDGDLLKELDQMDPEAKRLRLQELEKALIGGEEVHNEEKKKRRKKKLSEMEERQNRFGSMLRAVDPNDDEAMMRVFNNAQEEVDASTVFDCLSIVCVSFQVALH
jgi:hypothetical protein